MLVLSVPAPTSRANLTGCSNRTRLIRRSPLVLEIVRGGFAIRADGSLALLLRLARHAVTIRIKTRTVTRLATMQRRRASCTYRITILVVNTRLRRSLLNRLRGSLLSGSLSRRSLRRCLLDGRLRSYRSLLNRLRLLRGCRRNRSRRCRHRRSLSSRSLYGSLSRRNRRRGFRRGRRLRRRRTRRRRSSRGSRNRGASRNRSRR